MAEHGWVISSLYPFITLPLTLPQHPLTSSHPPSSSAAATYLNALHPNMEGNREEADRALQIARQHREQQKFTSALKFAKKSLSLYETPAAITLIKVIEKDIQSAASSTGNGSAEGSYAKTSSAEVHPSAAGTHHRPGHGSPVASTSAEGSSSNSKKREYTDAQHKLVKRITACKVTEYYEILSGETLGWRWMTARSIRC